MAFIPGHAAPLLRRTRVATSARPVLRRAAPARRAQVTAVAVTPQVVSEYSRYLKDVACVAPPAYLDGILTVLSEVLGEEFVQPSDRAALHPFLVPLTSAADGAVTGLLRWPTAPNDMELPVVRTLAGDLGLELLAVSSRCYVLRALAAADFSGRVAEREQIRAGCFLDTGYRDGDVDKSSLGLERFLIMKVGPFPDLYEGLVAFHNAKGDSQSALVTCEKAATVFPGWGRAHVFHAEMLSSMGRETEARDAARFSLQLPLWTLGGHEKVRAMGRLAGYEDDESLGKIYLRLYEDKREHEIGDGKAPEQVALDRAAYLLDYAVASCAEDWEHTREPLSELYQEGTLNEIATFVRY